MDAVSPANQLDRILEVTRLDGRLLDAHEIGDVLQQLDEIGDVLEHLDVAAKQFVRLALRVGSADCLSPLDFRVAHRVHRHLHLSLLLLDRLLLVRLLAQT
eukprot:6096591-Prymnesium_polylepis.1